MNPKLISVATGEKTIDIYQRSTLAIADLTDSSLSMCLNGIKSLFPGDKAAQIDDFWNLSAKARGIVFERARQPQCIWYVKQYLQAAAHPTAKDITKRRQQPTGGRRCLDLAPLTNDDAEGMFAHQSKAHTDGKGGVNRSRGIAMVKASHTFDLAADIKRKRWKRFKKMLKRKRAQVADWVEEHKDDEGFLNLFNEKVCSSRSTNREVVQL